MNRQAPTAPDLTRLIRNLREQLAGYRALIALAERQHAGLIGGRSDDVHALLADQERAIAAVQNLERERLALAGAADGDGPTVRDLIAGAPAGLAGELASVADDLRATIAELQTRNDRNGRLLERSITTLRRWQAYMIASFQPEPTYGADGGVQRDDRPRAMDWAA